jgi:diaminohydroxyphosphoribosylaminopyrimidine deaminase / 5-amino-6-(5-phosphoribosylamino)uracil reductase
MYKFDLSNLRALMLEAVDLANKGLGDVAPNPLVGALLCKTQKDNLLKVFAEGFHERYGTAHAEVNCLEQWQNNNLGIIDYNNLLLVTLEPCCHWGKTPPCTEMIIASGIKRIAVGSRDVDSRVLNKSRKVLAEANIEIIDKICEKECFFLNRRYYTYKLRERPYVILKWSESNDGFLSINSHTRVNIALKETWEEIYRWRSEEAAILVGKNTSLSDNPRLKDHRANLANDKRQPHRIYLDPRLEIPLNYSAYDNSSPTTIINSFKSELVASQTKLLKMDFPKKLNSKESKQFLEQLLSYCYQDGIQSILIEGGLKVLNEFIKAELWDEIRFIKSNKDLSYLLGGKANLLNKDLAIKSPWRLVSNLENKVFKSPELKIISSKSDSKHLDTIKKIYSNNLADLWDKYLVITN